MRAVFCATLRIERDALARVPQVARMIALSAEAGQTRAAGVFTFSTTLAAGHRE